MNQYYPILLQFLVAAGFVVLAVTLSWLLGPKVYGVHKKDAFESGLESVGNARMQFSIKYFLVATLFVLFDVEVIFFYPWAVSFSDVVNNKEVVATLSDKFVFLGKMLLFMAPVLIGFYYVLKKGALDGE